MVIFNSNNRLVGLDLDNILLTELPDVICEFTVLQELSLCNNLK
jgi:hypothetical protein